MPSHSQPGRNRRSPLIDIVMPMSNAAPYLAETIKGIQAQTETSWRLLILDDGSTDQSVKIAKKFAAEDPRIKLFRRPKRGQVATLNEGLALCRAPFIARHDADDISFTHRFKTEVDYLNSHPDCVAVSGGHTHIDHKGKCIPHSSWSPNPDLANPYWIPALEPLLLQPFLMVRANVFKRLRYRHFFIAEDADLCWRLQEVGKLHSMTTTLGCYRVHKKSASTYPPVNTRIQAVISQLAAIAARRRREGHGDFDLKPELYKRLLKANNFESILEVFRSDLNAEEFQYLCTASIVKFIETTTYRPSKVNAREAQLAYKELHAISLQRGNERSSILQIYRRAAKMLHKRGQHRLAWQLVPSLWGWLAVRMNQSWLMSRLPLPQKTRRLLGRRSPRASVQA